MFTAMETKKTVLYIDTGGSLSATRIKDMLQECKASLDDQVWQKVSWMILVFHPETSKLFSSNGY